MIQMYDEYTGDVLEYEDVDDFQQVARHSFDPSVHDVVDMLADAIRHDEYKGEFEAYLGVRVSVID